MNPQPELEALPLRSMIAAASLLSCAEAAAVLKRDPASVNRYRLKGLLPAIKIGGFHAFIEADVLAFRETLNSKSATGRRS